jgi:hypothetical protein
MKAEQQSRFALIQNRIGRNIVRVQLLESALIAVLPFLGYPGTQDPEEKRTLGLLVGSFRARLIREAPEFGTMLKAIVDDRNALAHEFHQKYGPLLETVGGDEELIRILDQQFESIREFEYIVNRLLLAILHDRRDSAVDPHTFEEFEEICKDFYAALAHRYPEAPDFQSDNV